MALYYNLPVYKASYKLMTMLFASSSGFAREYKYTTGQELKNEGMFLIKNIYRANKAMDKIVHIEKSRENLEMIRLFLRLMQDFGQLSLKKFVEINLAVEEVSKQLAAWEKYSRAKSMEKKPPESSVAAAQASVRSKSNNPLASSEECCPEPGHIARLHQKNRAINSEVILPLAGNRNTDGAFNNLGSNENSWSSSVSGGNAWKRNLNIGNSTVNRNTNNQSNGFSVRCVKDLQTPVKLHPELAGKPGTISRGKQTNMNQQLLLDLFRAYFDTRKNKRGTANALAFEAGYEEKLFKLYEEIVNREYKIGQSTCFVVDKPVKREIFAADFRDRIVHHLIFNYINPIFEKHFIKDSYSCRVDKGTSRGIKRIDHFIRSCSENYQKDCWILKLDIKGYFMAMDRNILYKKIERELKAARNMNFDIDLILYLIRTVVFHDSTKNCRVKGAREDWVGLPKSKSLFFAAEGKGFPIGNLTSQLFGNIYLNGLDHFAREKVGAKRYGRYVDDMVFVHSDKEFLKSAVSKTRDYLRKELELTLHPKKIYLQHFEKGVSFLGAFIKPYRIYIGKKTKKNFFAKAKMWNEAAEKKRGLIPNLPANSGVGGKEEAKKFVACVNSYLGIMKHYDTYILRKKMARSFGQEILKSVVFSKNFEKAILAG
ncbi:MAG: reverse transcriptase domain-containing protein [Parcubacteria group bacterium]|jgi:retron-type reverse transcriptase